MAQRVEARSLSQLNYLAANPPKYPVNPTEARQPPLTLYISRVPGSRDVILSTVKPQLKNVTGEDVANCFYLVHLDLPTDDLYLAGPAVSGSPTAGPAPTAQARPQAPSPIARKPLPASAKAPPPAPDPVQAPAPPAATADHSDPARAKPAAALGPDHVYPNRYGDLPAERPALPPRPRSHTDVPIQQQPQGPIARKPLVPRPLQAPYPPPVPPKDTPRTSRAGNLDALPPLQTSSSPSALQEQQQPLPRPPSASSLPPGPEPVHKASPPPPLNDFHLRPPQPPSPAKRLRELVPFTLTVIRRDPFTGNQWNVGKVSSFQQSTDLSAANAAAVPTGPTYAELAGVAPSAVAGFRDAAAAPAINILLENSGYAKFRGFFPTRESVDVASSRGRAGSAASSIFRGAQGGANSSADSLALEYFTRQLVMGYTKSWTTNIRDALRKSRSNSTADTDEDHAVVDEQPPSPLEPPPRPPFHPRSESSESVASFGSSVSLQALQQSINSSNRARGHAKSQSQSQSPIGNNGLATAPGPGLRPRGYVFASPWDGLCEFRTSSSGRSVKCLHSLGGLVSDPSSPPPAAVVSELRFNLPSADLFRDKGHEIQGKLDRLKLDGHGALGHHHHRGSKSVDAGLPRRSEDHALSDPLETEMGLGRERAGGGNRGKRAKLGKLIIYDEGLKMLDLIIAANMGVWWQAWERSF